MKVRIEFEVELPDVEHTEEELEEFLRFEFKDNASMSHYNPFNGTDVEPDFGTFEFEEID